MKSRYQILFIALSLLASCRDLETIEEENPEPISNPDTIITDPDSTVYADWTIETHTNGVDPDYSILFGEANLYRFDIVIDASNWSSMQSNLSSILQSSGGRPGGTADVSEDPMWVDCSIFFEEKEWYHVGVRYKGNSSLQSAYQSGNDKLSFKLDFDEFEDNYPDIANQRFYGFKQLNLNNNFNDASLMREKVGADLFRDFGLVSAHTNFCEVYVDYGSGPQYYGVYTIVEEVDDTVLDDQFGDDSGNLYKPDGDAASFASGTYDEGEFEKKNNDEAADYTDVRALYDLMQSSLRTSDEEAWKASLESVLDVDTFLKWLAANTVFQNWDTYGNMTHNFFLYNNPENNLLTWIPWDNNESLGDDKRSCLSFTFSEVRSSWPLIYYLNQVDSYKAIYETYLAQFTEEVFNSGRMTTIYESYEELLRESAYAEVNGRTYISYDQAFDNEVNELKSHVSTRVAAVNSYLY